MMADFQEALKKQSTTEVNEALYNALSSKKKAEFALDLLYMQDPESLVVPGYIKDGLNWLSDQLKSRPIEAK